MELSYILGNRNPEKIPYFQETELFYISGNENPKKFFIFQETELSYISGGTSKAPKTTFFCISPK